MEIVKIKDYTDIERILNNEKREFILDFEDCEIKNRKKVFDYITETNKCDSLKKLNKNSFYINLKEENK